MRGAYDPRTPYEHFLVNEIDRLAHNLAEKVGDAVGAEFERQRRELSSRGQRRLRADLVERIKGSRS